MQKRKRRLLKQVQISEEEILVRPGIKNVSNQIQALTGQYMCYLNWIRKRLEINVLKLGLGLALYDVVMVTTSDGNKQEYLKLVALIVD